MGILRTIITSIIGACAFFSLVSVWDFPLPAQETPKQPKNVCISCHLDTGDKKLIAPVKALEQKEDGQLVDVHARAGLSCQDCHGGDPTNEDTAMDKNKGYLGKPKPQQIPGICARCHSDIEYMKSFNPRLPTDQFREYQTSIHGKRLAAGDPKVATCVSCHGNHGIRSVKDPSAPVFPTNVPVTCARCHSDPQYMNGYGIHTDQFELYRYSKHGDMLLEQGDISAPTCITCHGNHGAVPPGVTNVHYVCNQCHAQQAEYFEKSTHASTFAKKKLSGCVTCHGNHEIMHPSDDMLNNKPGSVCRKCHQVDDSCFMAVGQIKKAMNDLTTHLTETKALLKKAEQLGMGVEQAQFSLHEVADHLTEARIKIHQFQKAVIEGELKDGKAIVQKAADRGNKALKEWQLRRIGLVVSLFLILLTILALIRKIKRLEHHSSVPPS